MSIIFFFDQAIPCQGILPGAQDLEHLHKAGTVCNRASLQGVLDSAPGLSTLVWLQGAVVPAELWPAITAFLGRGNGLVSLGRHPFSQALHRNDELCPQSAFFRDLSIHEELDAQWVSSANTAQVTIESSKYFPWFEGRESIFTPGAPCSDLVMMPTKHADCPGEGGSSGPMDAFIHRLISYSAVDGRPLAAPAVFIERARGPFAGACWCFITIDPDKAFWENGGASALVHVAGIVAQGSREVWLKPDFATFYPGEVPSLSIMTEALLPGTEERVKARLVLALEGKTLHETSFDLSFGAAQESLHLTLPLTVEPGLYSVKLYLTFANGHRRLLEQGFWGMDRVALERGSRLKAGEDYLERDGKPFPVVGMTYMASDVHRKFLELPNVAVWNADLGTMAKLGINYIRTGVWTAYRQVAFMDGQTREGFLRAVDAFILTCTRHGMECCFNFFAFTPEAWEGSNPWLDPRSLAAQKRYLSAVVSRHKTTAMIHWDLINEPSMFDPKNIFKGPRTLRDPFEVSGFIAWLKSQNSDIAHWRKRWDKTPVQLPDWAAVLPPTVDETGFGTTEPRVREHGIWLDYTLFTQYAFANWARDMAEFLRSISGDAMVTVGQDEGMGSQRPANQFFEAALDYTNIHNWWINDGLAWDSVFTKVGYKPNLIQETGIMHVEDASGRSRRSETELAELLERKYAYAFSSAGAGAVHWIWNINYHMDNNNESHIGACRADGSHKPEVEVSADFGAFFAAVGPKLGGRSLEDVAVMFPFSNDYGVRRSAVEATLRLTRVLAYELKVQFRSVGEYQLDSLQSHPPKVLILPSPQALSRQARLAIKAFMAKHQATLVLTGPADLDENWLSLVPGEDAELVPGAKAANPVREEEVLIADTVHRVVYSVDKIATIKKGMSLTNLARGSGMAGFETRVLGKGTLVWCPLPLELNDRTEPIAAFYRNVLAKAGCTPGFTWLSGSQEGIFAQRLEFKAGSLYILISESARAQTISFSDRHGFAGESRETGRGSNIYSLDLQPGRAALFFTDNEGRLVASLRNQVITLRKE